MAASSKELLQLEHKGVTISSLESAVLVCNGKRDSSIEAKKPLPHGTPLTAPVPPSQILGKVKDFLGVMSEANKRLELDAKDHPENYDIEELTGNEFKVIEMDLMLGVADLNTPEAVVAAESAISGSQPVIPLAAESSETETDSNESSSEEDNDNDGNDGKKSSSSRINERQKENRDSKKRPRIVELS